MSTDSLVTTPETPTGAVPLPPEAAHLVRLEGTDWALWRQAALRGAGFPARNVLGLANEELAAAADEVLAMEEELGWAQQQALEALRGEDSWGPRRRLLRRSERHLKRLRPCLPSPELDDVTGAAITAYNQIHEEWTDARAEFERAAMTTRGKTDEALRQAAADPRFQEAVLWQNRQAFRRGVQRLLQGRRCRRSHREIIARYLQRYCTKNDTIGFFGPVGWARWTGDGEFVEVRPGPQLVDDRKVGFEAWGIDRLTESLASDEKLRTWLVPRRLPFIRQDGDTVRRPLEEPHCLAAEEAEVLAACDGRRSARRLAAELPSQPGTALRSAQQVHRILAGLARDGWLAWPPEPPLRAHADRWLRRELDRIDDHEVRRSAFAKLERLEAARREVAAAAGDPGKLDRALGELDRCFAQLTDTSATRSPGRTYGARTLVYEDSRRQAEVRLGPELLASLTPTLDLVLTSSRWLTYRTGEAYRRVFERLYREFAPDGGEIDFMDFWFRAQRQFFGLQRPVDEVLARFRETWAEILDARAGMSRIGLPSEKLKGLVAERFNAPAAGWPGASHHSPDLMISAAGLDALQRGQYHLVLGEIHVASNTLSGTVFVEHHPRPEELAAGLAADLPVPRLLAVMPKNLLRATARTQVAVFGPRDYLLLTSADAASIDGPQAVALADLVMTEQDGELMVFSRDGQLRFGAVECFSVTLSSLLATETRLLPPWSHSPRVTIDRVVIARESWRFEAADLAFAGLEESHERFLEARRWARQLGMPRFVFARTSNEIKPMFVDLDSSIYVDVFAKEIRRCREMRSEGKAIVSVSEMLPAPDQTWLHDARGDTYTCELRCLALDLATHATESARSRTGRRAEGEPAPRPMPETSTEESR